MTLIGPTITSTYLSYERCTLFKEKSNCHLHGIFLFDVMIMTEDLIGNYSTNPVIKSREVMLISDTL